MLGELLSEPAPKTDTTPGLIQKYEAAKLTVANCVSDMYTPWGHSAVKQLVQEKVSRVVAYHAQPMQYCIAFKLIAAMHVRSTGRGTHLLFTS
jgi:hypothetical protein